MRLQQKRLYRTHTMKSTAQLDAPHKSTCQFSFMRQAMYEEEMRFKLDGLIILMIPF